jgi:hypothetical protein
MNTPARKVRVGVAALLAVGAGLALGPTAKSSTAAAAPGDNAVIHWSGVAEGAIAAGRPPASSSVLGGMVHAAMYDAVAAVEPGLDPFATTVTAPPGADADAAVAQAARDVLVARVSAQAPAVQAAYDAYMLSIPDGPAKDAGKAVGTAAAAGMLAMRTGDRFDDVVPYVQPTPGPGVFEPVAPTTPVDVKLPFVRPFTQTWAAHHRRGRPLELRSRRYARDLAEVQAYGSATSTVRTPAQTETARFFSEQTYVQFSRTLRDLAKARGSRPAGVGPAPGVHPRGHGGHDDRVLEGEAPLLLLASLPCDPAGRHRRQPRHLARPDVGTAARRKPPGVPVRARLLHGRGDGIPPHLLRDEARRDPDLEHRDGHGPHVRGPR